MPFVKVSKATVHTVYYIRKWRKSIMKNKQSPPAKIHINAGFLVGPTGIGAAKLMLDAENGKTAAEYNFSLYSNPAEILSALASGALDIAAVPTNAAGVLYNTTGGRIKIIAVSTMSVLYVLENGGSVHDVSDLRGKTVYITDKGSNPEYIMKYLLRKAGAESRIEFAGAGEIITRMTSGDIKISVLPEPAATLVLMQNADVRRAVDLGKAWEKYGGKIVQGCIAASAGENAVKAFLPDYKASVLFMSDPANIDEAAALSVKYGMMGSVDLAKKAIPNCGLTFISGRETMKEVVSGYFGALNGAFPDSVGGKVPDDDFYCE